MSEDYIRLLENENRLIREENKILLMRLAGIKTIISMVQPACTQKLEKLLNDCQGCKEDE